MKKSTVIITWGLITGLAMCLAYLALYLSGNILNTGLAFAVFIVLFAGLLIGTLQYRNKVNGGHAAFGELYKTGILISVVVVIVVMVYWFVFVKLNPSYPEQIKEYQEAMFAAKAKANQEVSPEQVAMSKRIAGVITSPFIIMLSGLFNGLIGGAVLSLITAAICSKSRPLFEEENKNTMQS